MRAYIDESGDPGIGRGTRWLVFGLVLVSDRDVASAEGVLGQALSDVFRAKNKHYFHFRKMGHIHKLAVLPYFARAPWVGCLLARDTTDVHSLPQGLRPEVALYWQMAGYLLEVISSRSEYLREEATVYFEPRDINPATLPAFLSFVQNRIDDGALKIDSRWISLARIYILEPEERRGHLLSGLADGLAHAGFSAVEPNPISGQRDEAFYRVLVPKLWGRHPLDGVNIYDCGLLFRPKRRWPEFVREYPWLALS